MCESSRITGDWNTHFRIASFWNKKVLLPVFLFSHSFLFLKLFLSLAIDFSNDVGVVLVEGCYSVDRQVNWNPLGH
ncbi:hypothetical protein MLD38_035124 [Melastoma candidum]|uniref:Uncharacterized protein n=1 Tax=Melastoma candidum TaxID=119954 RepID=A0ACB9MDE5_9MYRT|nr:hypothetical protein MLD38_035124 [Melastoma candidum]